MTPLNRIISTIFMFLKVKFEMKFKCYVITCIEHVLHCILMYKCVCMTKYTVNVCLYCVCWDH
jgi:hypothetical protein